jgi:tRNA(fMet)-specific endonuclease VapC
MSGLLMLDTNALSAVMKARSPALDRRLANEPFCISVVTEAEIRFGLAHRQQRTGFSVLAEGVLGRIDIRPWTSATAHRYGPLRAELVALGKPLAPLDLMIAAHALAEGATLVTADRAFSRVPGLAIQDYEHA